MNENFLYVFDVGLRNELLEKGYNLLKSDERQGIYIFENSNLLTFTKEKSGWVFSDALTF